MVNINVVVIAGTISGEPVTRRMPSGDEVTELRVSCPVKDGQRVLPLPVAVWRKDLDADQVAQLDGLSRGDGVLVHGSLVRRFYRSGAGARSLTEIVASGIKALTAAEVEEIEEAS